MDRFTRRMQLIDMVDFRPLPFLLQFSVAFSVFAIILAFFCAIFAQLNALRIVDILLFTDFSNGIPGLQFLNWIPVFYGCLTLVTLLGLQMNALITLIKLAKAFTHHMREMYDYEQLVNSYQQFDNLVILHEVAESAWNLGNMIDILLLKLPFILCGVYVACDVKNITVGALMVIVVSVIVYSLLAIAYLIPAILYHQHREPILEAYLKMGERIELTNAFWLHLERIRTAPTFLSLGNMVRLTGRSIGTVSGYRLFSLKILAQADKISMNINEILSSEYYSIILKSNSF